MADTNPMLRGGGQFFPWNVNRTATKRAMAATPPASRAFTVELRRDRPRHATSASKLANCRVGVSPAESPQPGAEGHPQKNPAGPVSGPLMECSQMVDSCSLPALHQEISQLKEAIQHMKREIATLRMEKPPAPSLQKATCELDAVVQSTEDATHNILEAAEQIDTLLLEVRGKADLSIAPAALEQISDQVIRIFESCNFQDITGQRINKVVTAMKFIEVKIDNMIEILGGSEALLSVEIPVEEEIDEDAKLLEGPQLEGAAKISQNDIDRFFD